jgi:hypothetical protein
MCPGRKDMYRKQGNKRLKQLAQKNVQVFLGKCTSPKLANPNVEVLLTECTSPKIANPNVEVLWGECTSPWQNLYNPPIEMYKSFWASVKVLWASGKLFYVFLTSLVPRESICIGQKDIYREKRRAQVERTSTGSKEIKDLYNSPKKYTSPFGRVYKSKPCLASPHLASPHLASPCLASPCLAKPRQFLLQPQRAVSGVVCLQGIEG